MAEQTEFNLHFITDPLLGTETANSVAKTEMARAFCRQSRVTKLYFYAVSQTEKKLRSLRLGDISEKMVLKPLFFNGYKDKTLYGRSFWSFCYKLFFASPLILLRAFFLALSLRKTEKVYIRGFESLFGFYLGSVVTNAEYAFEQHNYTFGKHKIADFFYLRIMKKAKFIVTVSEYTRSGWVSNGIDETKIIVLPSGVNMEDFEKINKNKTHLRIELGLPEDKKIITYTGGLYENRGIEELLHCASKHENHLFLFLGGLEKHVEKYRSYMQSEFHGDLPNVKFKGYLKHGMIAMYLKASDILAAPYSKKIRTASHMSPIKLTEYMASKVPVITSDLHRIRDIASGDEVTFFEPDNPGDLREKIAAVFENYEQAKTRALKAYERAGTFSWDNRAERITRLLAN